MLGLGVLGVIVLFFFQAVASRSEGYCNGGSSSIVSLVPPSLLGGFFVSLAKITLRFYHT